MNMRTVQTRSRRSTGNPRLKILFIALPCSWLGSSLINLPIKHVHKPKQLGRIKKEQKNSFYKIRYELFFGRKFFRGIKVI